MSSLDNIIYNINNLAGNSVPYDSENQLPSPFVFKTKFKIDLENGKRGTSCDLIIFDNFNDLHSCKSFPHTKFYAILPTKVDLREVLSIASKHGLHWSDWHSYPDYTHIVFFKRRSLTTPEWTGQTDTKDKMLFVYSEWGWGDIFRNLRFLRQLSEIFKKVIFETRKGLNGLIENWFDNIEIWNKQSSLPSHNYHVRLELVHKLLPLKTEIFHLPSFQITKKKLNIGVVWKSSHMTLNDRDYPPNVFKKLQNDYQFWSFHLENPDYLTPILTDYKDWLNTAIAVNSMNLIVTSDTALAHLSGCLNKRCIVLLRSQPYPTVMNENSKEWYPNTLVLRSQHADWHDLHQILSGVLKDEKKKIIHYL